MATGRVTRVRSAVGSVVTGRVTRVRSVATQVGAPFTGRVTKVRTVLRTSATGRVTKVRSVSVGASPQTRTVEPFASVQLGAGSWVQTGGMSVAVPSFAAPAVPAGGVLQFNAAGSIATITVLPHTFFALGTGGALSALNRNGATTVGATPAPGTYSDTYTTGY